MIETNLIEKALQRVDEFKELVRSDPYYPSFHIAPPVGLLNDPNGFIQWNGTYHLFYQWMPFHTGHGAKFWAHLTSTDLLDWTWREPALAPDRWYDRSGCYSGSAVQKDGDLYLFYTGNVKNEKGERETYQCRVRSKDGHTFEKEGVFIHLPEGFTPHFRDPKVWETENGWYMVVGAQTDAEKGCVVLYRSDDLDSWTYEGIIASGMGYMWECPDYFSLEDGVLMFSPQGVEAEGIDYRNEYQSGYILGDFHRGFPVENFKELDHGFEFYAPQTTRDERGRRLLVGWMGMPDGGDEFFPTHDYQWIHQMTLPRELIQKGEHLLQRPVEELTSLRAENVVSHQGDSFSGELPKAAELVIEDPGDEFRIDLFRVFEMERRGGRITIRRPRLMDAEKEWRAADLVGETVKEIRVFVDHSSVEIFINDGEVVFSSRMFPEEGERTCRIEGEHSMNVWKLRQAKGGE